MVIGQSKLRQPTQLRLVDDVYQSLETAILSGHLPPGERLIEARIGEELGVSRTTVREALLKLERQGLVVNNPRRGTFVTRLSQADALDLGYARALLECFAVSIGHAAIDEQTLAQLEACCEEMSTCVLPEDLPRLIGIDLAFHRLLVESSGSSRLLELWSSLNGQIGALFIRGVEHQHANTAHVVTLHRRLVTAVRGSNVAALQQAVFEHYVRPPADAPNHGAVLQQAIATISPHYIVSERPGDDLGNDGHKE